MAETQSVPAGAKKRDYWWTVIFTDPVALPLVTLLARRKLLTPDQVTVIAFVLGIGVGPLFALATRTGFIAGGLLFYAAFVVDCVDGKLARALGTTSSRGEALDKLADAGRRASASLGLTIGLWRSEPSGSARFLWAVAYAVTAYYFIELSGAPKHVDQRDDGREGGGMSLGRRWADALGRRRLLPTPGMPDAQAIAFIVGPITGLLVPGLVIALVMVSAGLLLSAARRVRAP